jgi:hypothetical protein
MHDVASIICHTVVIPHIVDPRLNEVESHCVACIICRPCREHRRVHSPSSGASCTAVHPSRSSTSTPSQGLTLDHFHFSAQS